ncbi:MAG: hypothetical protein M3R15_15220 [Acidobacteriota bacterium]|nr:hypothetical protein [Acidobacteriota bacterium]
MPDDARMVAHRTHLPGEERDAFYSPVIFRVAVGGARRALEPSRVARLVWSRAGAVVPTLSRDASSVGHLLAAATL